MRLSSRVFGAGALAAVLVLWLLPAPDAYAYIDPATGSLLLQGLIAFVAGATFAFKNFYRTKVKAAIDFLLRRKPATDGDGAAEPAERKP